MHIGLTCIHGPPKYKFLALPLTFTLTDVVALTFRLGAFVHKNPKGLTINFNAWLLSNY